MRRAVRRRLRRLVPRPPSIRGLPKSPVRRSPELVTLFLGSAFGFQVVEQSGAFVSTPEGFGLDGEPNRAQRQMVVAVPEVHLVAWFDAELVAKRPRDDDLALGSHLVSHTLEYNTTVPPQTPAGVAAGKNEIIEGRGCSTAVPERISATHSRPQDASSSGKPPTETRRTTSRSASTVQSSIATRVCSASPACLCGLGGQLHLQSLDKCDQGRRRRVGTFCRKESSDHFWTKVGATCKFGLAQVKAASTLIQCADDRVNLIYTPARGAVPLGVLSGLSSSWRCLPRRGFPLALSATTRPPPPTATSSTPSIQNAKGRV